MGQIALLPKRCQERVVRLEVLANEGNFKHNSKVLKDGTGSLIVGRRTSRGANPTEYLPCEDCKKCILKRTLYICNELGVIWSISHKILNIITRSCIIT